MPRKIETEADRERAREYGRWYYRQHREQEHARVAERKRQIHQWFEAYKATLVCQHCGENHPATLVFHHRDPKTKEILVTQAVHNGWGVNRILEEIGKCDVLCTNCHKRLHAGLGDKSRT